MIGVLEALDRQYDVLAWRSEVPAFGFSRERITCAVMLDARGSVTGLRDLRSPAPGSRLQILSVPQGVRRTTDITPNLFWDKTGYALGRTALDRNVEREHDAFLAVHRALLNELPDPVVQGFGGFLESWRPERLNTLDTPDGFLDGNVVFEVEGVEGFLHEHPSVQELAVRRARSDAPAEVCLVTGRVAPIARLHPVIKGVFGAPTSGAMLVSFNADSACSHGKRQGENAPIAQETAFRYGAALNRMLEPGGGYRLRSLMGDATVLCWPACDQELKPADHEAAQRTVEAVFGQDRDGSDAASLGEALSGRAVGPRGDRLDDVRQHVLALSPNVGRLWVRSWTALPLRQMAQGLREHQADIALEPAPWRWPPTLMTLLSRSVGVGPERSVPPVLAARALRSLLNGEPYPNAWFSAALRRVRLAEGREGDWAVGALKAILARRHRLGRTSCGVPVSLDRMSEEPAYVWGRLFAVWESAQRRAVGRSLLRRRFFTSASIHPAQVFPTLERGARAHLAALARRGRGAWLEAEIDAIKSRMARSLPRRLPPERQVSFILGHYHQHSELFLLGRDVPPEPDETE